MIHEAGWTVDRRPDTAAAASGSGSDVGAAEDLIRLSRLVQVIHGRVAANHGLTQVQAKMVCLLVLGSCGMADLARRLGVEPATLTGVVDRAEQRGLVVRSQVPGDRRALEVSLTESGHRAAAAFHREAVEQLSGLLAPLSTTQIKVFRRAMAKIISDGHC